MLPVTKAEWEQALNTPLTSTIQTVFQTNYFERFDHIFSDVLAKLPLVFPKFKLNTIGRGLHSTLFYLDGLTLDQAREVIAFLKSLDRATLAYYDLLRAVKVFDPVNIEFGKIGRSSIFGALKPHQEFVDWQLRFYKMINELAENGHPTAIFMREKHLNHGNHGEPISGKIPLDRLFDPKGVHISMIQWGEAAGYEITPAQEMEALQTLKGLVQESVEDYKKTHNGRPPLITFSLESDPLELVTAPVSIHSPATPIVSLRVDRKGNPRTSSVGRWSIVDEKTQFRKVVEFDTEKFSKGDAHPYELKIGTVEDEWIESGQYYEPQPIGDFKKQLNPNLRRAFEIAEKTLSPSKLPAQVASHVYVTTQTHPQLAADKGDDLLKIPRELGFHSTRDVSIGWAVYASSVRKEFHNPADLDLLLNALVHVPKEVKSLKDAEDFAVKAFLRDVKGQVIEALKKKNMALMENRISSHEAMKRAEGLRLLYSTIVDDLESSDYLSGEDLRRGYYTDKSDREWDFGRLWQVKELVKQRQFDKDKADYFNGTREEMSRQYLLGFEWDGSVYFVNRDGLKGVPPLMRTAVYDGAESYAIAATLSRARDYFEVQKGPYLPRVLRDVVRTAFGYLKDTASAIAPVTATPRWKSKFLKKFYNYVILLHRSGLGLDEIFFNETKLILQKEGRWVEGYNYGELFEHIIDAINQPEVRLLTALRRNLNDYREFNERKQRFEDPQWTYRAVETDEMLQDLKKTIRKGVLKPDKNFTEALRKFIAVFNKAKGQADVSSSIDYIARPELHATLREFEGQLEVLEAEFLASDSKIALNSMDKAFMQTMTSYAVPMYFRYTEARSLEAKKRIEWSLRFLGVDPSAENIESIRELADRMGDLSRADFAALEEAKLPHSVGAPSSGGMTECEILMEGAPIYESDHE